MKTSILILCLLILEVGTISVAWADRPGEWFQKNDQKYRQLLSLHRKKSSTQNQWFSLISEFERLHNSYPAHPKAGHSLFRIGKIYRILFHLTQQEVYLNRSIRAFRHVIQSYPQSTLVDDSQFIIGKIFEEDKQEPMLALLEYRKVPEMYDGDQKFLALQRIEALYKTQLPEIDLPATIPTTTLPSKLSRVQGGLTIEKSRKLPKGQLLLAQYWSTPRWARIVMNLDRPIPYIYGELPQSPREKKMHPHAFYLDLLDTELAASLEPMLKESSSLLSKVELRPINSRITRLSFILKENAPFRVIDYEIAHQHLITIEISPRTQPPLPVTNVKESTIALTPQTTSSTSEVQRIIIDPGHGGKDPGAISFGIQEKDVVLSVALMLRQKLQETTDLDVFLTRQTDRFVSIAERSALARQYNGDLFISLHANAHPEKKVQGIETYFLDVTSNETSRKLAIRENAMSDQGLQNFSVILRDLLSVSHSTHSTMLANAIHEQLITNVHTNYHSKIRNLGVKEAPFVVLLVGMPAALIEISFITNPKDNQRLQDPRYQKVVAEGVALGIQHYIQRIRG